MKVSEELLVQINTGYLHEGAALDAGQIAALERELNALVDEIAACSTLESAEAIFIEMDRLRHVLAKLVFQFGMELNERLERFVRELDRIDDPGVKLAAFNDIRLGGFLRPMGH